MGQEGRRVGGGRFLLSKMLGSGSFGQIYIAKDSEQGDRDVALKLEVKDTKHPQLIYEAKLLKLLQGSPGVAEIFYFGFEEDFAVMAMELMGPSLEDVFNLCKRKLSLKSTLMLADQLLLRIEHFHNRHYIHRDIKPDNFLIGRGQKSNLVYIIDFGLAKKYRNPETLVHGPYRENKNLTGTARYASLNAHLGIEQSRRDDLEAIGFVLVYFLKGSLPWQGIKAEGKHDKYAAIMEMKIKMTFTELCQGLPEEFATFLSYARHLAFDEDPDYRYMRWLFKSLYHREGFRNDGCFDWNVVRARPPSEVAERREARLRKMSVVASQPSDRAADDVVLSFRSSN
ncbi:Csnk1d [Symbiodinium microadriaticum]|nr:Csnk1d [Symbiodinium microadriaticum]